MRNLKVSAIAALPLFALIPFTSFAAERVGDFSLLDQQGYNHSMSRYDHNEAVVFLVQANDSAATEAALPAFNALKSAYEDRGVEFMMINPMGRLNREAVQAKAEEYGLEIPVLMDDTQVISEALGIERTGEVLVYDPK